MSSSIDNIMKQIYNEEYLRRAAEYVAMQCTGCPDSPRILAIKAFEVMKAAAKKGEDPYKALDEFMGTNVTKQSR